ncbi:peroxiredoxin family protein [Akkermansiaceae bacterium]|nr:peroxiredoxin family protein [Akkermansiaceae bacterium]MDA7618870.1 peroxiredoxin family protein [bacterium]MDA7648969.1 peroxiredoxin family protein [Akkermansiaceae bacterium]MDA8960329.1 peroxiredoxin family protein [Akkermansiaceae bacterium]MDB0056397.1 peroxiredoxin family protein [Akkermansiaceae bacterium]
MRLLIASLTLSLVAASFAGTATQARNYTRAYDQAFETWVARVQAAQGKEAQAAAWGARPSPDDTGRRLWVEIRNNLNESWTLDYAAWLYENSPAVLAPVRAGANTPTRKIYDAVKRFHTKSPRVGYFCVALPKIPNPGSLSLLEQIEKENPDPRIQGAAAMGQAIALRGMGDDWKIVGKRQEKLRQAIIKGNDLPVGKTTILRLAEDEIFIMNNLTVGTTAPDIKGIDIGLKPFSLSDYRGKVVVLAFWHTWMPEAERSIELLRALHEDLQGKNAVVLGVNQDHALTLRKMTADGTTPWRNFADSKRAVAKNYRISDWPKVFVIDVDGKIRHIDAPGAFVNIAVDSLLKK